MAGLCHSELDLRRKNSVQFLESSKKILSIHVASSNETLVVGMTNETHDDNRIAKTQLLHL